MRYLLSPDAHPILTQLARERTLCAFDFDGTLAPITLHPDQAAMRDHTRRLLAAVAALYPCIILSGRARADLLEKLRGVQVERVIGNHGAEVEGTVSNVRQYIDIWKTALQSVTITLPGIWVEDKGLSLAVHYRQSPRKAEARRRVMQAARKLEKSCVFGGKEVVNLVVCGSPDKGKALAAERDRLRCTWVIYTGDDENDEGAFALAGNTVAVRVGRKQQSHAQYYLQSQAEIDRLLEVLAGLRSNRSLNDF
jgi:trehalose 6-phosphate phosphatase